MKRMRRFWITAVLTLILALTISAGAEAAPGRQSDWFVPFGELGKKVAITYDPKLDADREDIPCLQFLQCPGNLPIYDRLHRVK